MSEHAGAVNVRKRGAPRGNANGMKHGLRSAGGVMDFRLTLGKFPCKWRYIENAVNPYRASIEQDVIERHGRISLYHAGLIQTAARWEAHAMLVRRWLMDNIETLSPTEKSALSKAVAEASTARDKCLERLGLHQTKAGDTEDVWADLAARRAAQLAIDAPGDEPGSDDADDSTATDTATTTTEQSNDGT